jgi:hypothetical protein
VSGRLEGDGQEMDVGEMNDGGIHGARRAAVIRELCGEQYDLEPQQIGRHQILCLRGATRK